MYNTVRFTLLQSKFDKNLTIFWQFSGIFSGECTFVYIYFRAFNGNNNTWRCVSICSQFTLVAHTRVHIALYTVYIVHKLQSTNVPLWCIPHRLAMLLYLMYIRYRFTRVEEIHAMCLWEVDAHRAETHTDTHTHTPTQIHANISQPECRRLVHLNIVNVYEAHDYTLVRCTHCIARKC